LFFFLYSFRPRRPADLSLSHLSLNPKIDGMSLS
jgi:hypothetical protein